MYTQRSVCKRAPNEYYLRVARLCVCVCDHAIVVNVAVNILEKLSFFNEKALCARFESQSKCLAWATHSSHSSLFPFFFDCMLLLLLVMLFLLLHTFIFFRVCAQSNALGCFLCYVYVFFLWIYFDGYCFHAFFFATKTNLSHLPLQIISTMCLSLCVCIDVSVVFVDHRRRNEKNPK